MEAAKYAETLRYLTLDMTINAEALKGIDSAGMHWLHDGSFTATRSVYMQSENGAFSIIKERYQRNFACSPCLLELEFESETQKITYVSLFAYETRDARRKRQETTNSYYWKFESEKMKAKGNMRP